MRKTVIVTSDGLGELDTGAGLPRRSVLAVPMAAPAAAIAQPPPVPTTAIWSRSDGLVNGAICRDGHGRAIKIRSSHLGVQIRPDVLLAVASVLTDARRPETARHSAESSCAAHDDR